MLFDSLIEKFIGAPVVIPTEESRRVAMKENVRHIVAACASGNVLLQRGQFTTGEELEKLRAENLKYDYGRSK